MIVSHGSGAPGRAAATAALLFVLAGCSGPTAAPEPQGPNAPVPSGRVFRMGFTPWPYDATPQAVDDVYDKIGRHGDLTVHHLDAGVPWPEAAAGQPYHPAVEAELGSRIARSPSDRPLYLAIAPLNSRRNGLADYWGSDAGLPRPGEWSERSFSHPAVVQAYTAYALDLIERFRPDYFNYGVEASDLILSNPQAFEEFVGFAASVYAAVKAAHPTLPTFVSVALKHPSSADTDLLIQGMARLAGFTDMAGVSAYPYIFFGHPDAGDPGNLPADWLAQARRVLPGKPLAIAETGWIAETLSIPDFGVSVPATPAFQRGFVERLLAEADSEAVAFVVWFFVQDFDRMWEGVLGRDPVAAIWRDSGLYDEEGVARPGLEVWDAWRDGSLP